MPRRPYKSRLPARAQPGFTSLEALLALAIFAILLAAALPGVGQVIERARLASFADALTFSLRATRLEAIKSGTTAVMCASLDPLAGAPACADSTFDRGWIVFVDRDADGAFGATDVLVYRQEKQERPIAMASAEALHESVRFSPIGGVVDSSGLPAAGSLALSNGQDRSILIAVNVNGRIFRESP